MAAARSVVVLHATEAVSVYLSAWARCGATREEVEDVLYRDRSIVKQMAMRRTVFAVPRDLLPAVRGSAAARVATQQQALLARSLVTGGVADDVAAASRWVERACAQVLTRLQASSASTRQLREELPLLALRLPRPEAPTAPPAPLASRVLTVLAATGQVVRGDNQGDWTTSRPLWTPLQTWIDGSTDAARAATRTAPYSETLPEAQGYAELVRRWLWSYGPGTETDLTWWLGATKTAVRRALVDVGAVEVNLQDGSQAWLHPDDVDEVQPPRPWAALLPALDPTTMGWKGRAFHVDTATAATVYDRAGNGLPTAWWSGRIVGTWSQQSDGAVIVQPHVPLSTTAERALRHKAGEVTTWLDGRVLRTTFHRPLPGP